ncbi:hypothetical protein GUITHDRAFT_117645 [Guillardia theta CCMP2712]|uniref:Uncharacterized protein n=1 Tax=Guillardia theta (strain CCMP2712) TaxID=905079 RepID=L1I4T0_GUITC|nr:hypothetical protein GUITHDRAFT_122907 [Guillardia theta CCMP2712]XP_005823117.1 hypothetical protein GUITHDRAFT_117645 [Guillardia theta CCMP2712]EKX30889.1 hypothetical protein GUITHDRAFT_122907 [Guillardia theta CCMP2712]EKX36137.1 hypothetical protein GUITHDRAFT_117645 [Guillardia theta CCMP2712]|eukprot:XP_005817869.1 hypothetical protein GUITHDRAFT_122907 [Guillardia theta CCMP2712]
MKQVDLTRNQLVVAGKAWEHERSPCCRDMIRHLVRRECYCSWFQPSGGGLQDQFPAIRMGESYYTLSLRIQKAMFRHVRLTKGFRNVERLPDGRLKLRIPTQLLVEKKRTATRFTVMRSKSGAPCGVGKPSYSKRVRLERKAEASDLIDLTDIINGILGPAAADSRPSYTAFFLSEAETAEHVVQHLFRECPTLTRDRMEFVRSMTRLYDKIVQN